jgi:hypothetical protein
MDLHASSRSASLDFADPCLHANDLLSARSLTLEPYEPSPPSLRGVPSSALEARSGMRSSRCPCAEVVGRWSPQRRARRLIGIGGASRLPLPYGSSVDLGGLARRGRANRDARRPPPRADAVAASGAHLHFDLAIPSASSHQPPTQERPRTLADIIGWCLSSVMLCVSVQSPAFTGLFIFQLAASPRGPISLR